MNKLYSALLAATACCLVSSGMVAAKGIKIPNEIAHWTADGTSASISGVDPILLEGATYTDGVQGKAFHFDGSSQFAHIPFSSDFDIKPEGELSLSAWVRPEKVGSYQAIVIKVHEPGVWEWGIIIDPRNHFYAGHNAFDVAQSQTTIQPNHWYFVALTYDNGTYKVYVNGKLESQATGSKIPTSDGGLSIGRKGETPRPGDDPDWFAGSIDEIRFFNRALTDDEVLRLYHTVPKADDLTK